MGRWGWLIAVVALALERAAFATAGNGTIEFSLAWSYGRPLPWLTDLGAVVAPLAALLAGAWAVTRFGARRVAIASGALLAAGWALAAFTTLPPLALVLIAAGRGGLRPALVIALAESVTSPSRRMAALLLAFLFASVIVSGALGLPSDPPALIAFFLTVTAGGLLWALPHADVPVPPPFRRPLSPAFVALAALPFLGAITGSLDVKLGPNGGAPLVEAIAGVPGGVVALAVALAVTFRSRPLSRAPGHALAAALVIAASTALLPIALTSRPDARLLVAVGGAAVVRGLLEAAALALLVERGAWAIVGWMLATMAVSTASHLIPLEAAPAAGGLLAAGAAVLVIRLNTRTRRVPGTAV